MKTSISLIKIAFITFAISIISFCIGFYFLLASDTMFFSIVEHYRTPPLNTPIHASYSNLGSITIHFTRFAETQGTFEFILKEQEKKESLYSAKYTLSDIFHLPTYPFGFPIISNSENKTYIVTISSPNLVVNNENITYDLTYSYSLTKLLRGENIIQFIRGKYSQYLSLFINSQHIVFFISPAVVYLLFALLHLFLKDQYKRLENTELYRQGRELVRPTFLMVMTFIIFDILFIPKPNDFIIIIICIIWSLLIFSYRYTSQKSFVSALFFMFICSLLLISLMEPSAEKAAVWAYMFLVVGTLHILTEQREEQDKNNPLGNIRQILGKIVIWDSYCISLIKKHVLFISIQRNEFAGKKMTKQEFTKYIIKEIKKYIVFMFYILIVTSIILSLVLLYTKAMSFRDRKLKNPSIQLLEPLLVYPSTKVILIGNSFGSKIDERYRLVKDGEEIRTDYWEDHKIIFTVPLGWKNGFMNIWIEKPVQWNGETIIEKTKSIQIKLLPVSSWNSPDDDLYFEQMKKWQKETKEINGYK